MLAQSKILRLFCLLAFSWLALYQISDGGEDTAEDLTAGAQISQARNQQLLPLPKPDNDPDDLIPQVVDQTLFSNHSEWQMAAAPGSELSSSHILSAATPLVVTAQDLSPPSRRINEFSNVSISHQRLILSAIHSLAPPLA
jgi:hypothetical protein